MRIRRDYSGQTITGHAILAPAGIQSGNRLWQVRCRCGREYPALIQNLRKAPGCRFCVHKSPRPYRRKRPYEWLYNTFVNRGRHPVSLTYEQFVELTSISECHYCGSGIVWESFRVHGQTTASNLDRKDSSGSYSAENVVVCCWRCNKAKNTLFSYEEWKEIGAVIRQQDERRALAALETELTEG